MTAPPAETGTATTWAESWAESWMTARTDSWVPEYATRCAEAVVHALDLLDGDDVETVPDTTGPGFTLNVLADPPPPVRALHWTPDTGWTVTGDAASRRAPRWSPLPLAADADPLELCEALA
jgi:hypothetical protein